MRQRDFSCCFSQHLVILEPQSTVKQGKRENDKSTLFYPPTGGGRFGSLAFAMKNRHFGGECSWILAGKARKCGRFWVFARAPNPGKQSIWRQCPPCARKESTKKLPNRPGFTHVPRGGLRMPLEARFGKGMSAAKVDSQNPGIH